MLGQPLAHWLTASRHYMQSGTLRIVGGVWHIGVHAAGGCYDSTAHESQLLMTETVLKILPTKGSLRMVPVWQLLRLQVWPAMENRMRNFGTYYMHRSF